MSIYQNWKMCLFAAMLMLVYVIFTGDALGLAFLWMWYYLAIAFERYEEALEELAKK